MQRPIVVYDTSQLHPDDLLGILVFEDVLYGVVNNYPVGRSAVPYESIDMYANNNRTFRVYVKTPELNVVDLTSAVGVFTMRTQKGAATATLTKSTAIPAQGQIGSADQGEMFFYILPADTAALDIRQYVFDVKVTLSTGKVYTVSEGAINLLQPVG